MTANQQDIPKPLDVAPVPVHVMGIEAGLQLGQAPAAAPASASKISTRPYTVVLSTTVPVETLLDYNPKRQYALVQAGGNDVVISNNKGNAQNAANQTPGLPAPLGMVLPFGNTVPTLIPGGERWWAAAAAYPAQITVLAVFEEC